jgi:hypothetical protein
MKEHSQIVNMDSILSERARVGLRVGRLLRPLGRGIGPPQGLCQHTTHRTRHTTVLGCRIDRWDSTPGRARISISDATSDNLWCRPNEASTREKPANCEFVTTLKLQNFLSNLG